MVAATVALDVLLAARALLGHVLDCLQTSSFFVVFDAALELLARFSFVPRPIAGDAGLCTAFMAGADVGDGFALRDFLHRSPLRSYVASGFFDLRRRFVHLPCSAAWCQAPTPARGLVFDASPLQLVESLVDALRSMQLDVAVLHELRAFGAGDVIVGRAVDLYCDPLFETSLTCIDEMGVAVVGWKVLWER